MRELWQVIQKARLVFEGTALHSDCGRGMTDIRQHIEQSECLVPDLLLEEQDENDERAQEQPLLRRTTAYNPAICTFCSRVYKHDGSLRSVSSDHTSSPYI